MRKGLFVAGYLIVMTVLGFVIVPRLVGRPHTRSTVTSTPFALAQASTPPAAPPSASPSPTPSSLPVSEYPPQRLVIPTLNLNTGWETLGYLSDGLTMQSPVGPRDLGWYSFSDQPGGTSNAIFSGHVDWYTGERAIFAGLTTLQPGAEIMVSRADGRLRTYKVTSAKSYDFATTDATPIIAPTDKPTLTLITCGGVFNANTHEYDKRLVVVATAPD